MGSPIEAYNLLSESNIVKAGAFSDRLVSLNKERKYLVANIMKK